MNTVSDIYPKLLKLSASEVLAAARVFPSRDSDDDGEKMTWERRSDWERTARELGNVCRTLVLEARGMNLAELREAMERFKQLDKDLANCCKRALHCGNSLHSGTEPEHVFPISLEWAEKGNIAKDRLDKFLKAFRKQYEPQFSDPKWVDLDFDVLTELPKASRDAMAHFLEPVADEDGHIEHAEPVSEVLSLFQELFP